MALRKWARKSPTPIVPFSAQVFLGSSGLGRTIGEYRRGETIFTQGDDSEDVLYIQAGGVRLTMRSPSGKEALVATLGPGDFFGESCLADQPLRTSTATAITPSVILLVGKDRMTRTLRTHPAMAGRFITHMLSRNARAEEDLADQIFRSPKMTAPSRTAVRH
jgi:CRP/FNR family transcriptional regulator, cyclic AMP receptor protein